MAARAGPHAEKVFPVVGLIRASDWRSKEFLDFAPFPQFREIFWLIFSLSLCWNTGADSEREKTAIFACWPNLSQIEAIKVSLLIFDQLELISICFFFTT